MNKLIKNFLEGSASGSKLENVSKFSNPRCFLCKYPASVVSTQEKPNCKELKLWKQSLTSSLVELYSSTVPLEFWTQLDSVDFCTSCFQLILDVDFFNRNIKTFQTNLQGLKKKIDKLIQNDSVKPPAPLPLDSNSAPYTIKVESDSDSNCNYQDDDYANDSFCEQVMDEDEGGRKSLTVKSSRNPDPERKVDADHVLPVPIRTRSGRLVSIRRHDIEEESGSGGEEDPDSDAGFSGNDDDTGSGPASRLRPPYYGTDINSITGKPRPNWQRQTSCPTCGKKYWKYKNLQAHIKSEHEKGEPDYKCTLCERGFFTLEYLRKHCKRVHTLKAYEAMKPSQPPEIRKPIIKKPRKPRVREVFEITCELCGKLLNNNYFHQHMKTVHDDSLNKLKCSVCGKLFGEKEEAELAEHEKLHESQSAPVPFVCVLCLDFETGSKRNLEKHVLENHEENVYRCDLCPAILLTELRLKKHKAEHRYKNDRNHICEICGWVGISPSKLRDHKVKHDTIRPFKCEVPGCEVSFKTRKSLRSHQCRAHGKKEEFPWACPECPEKFHVKFLLDRHVVSHSDVRQFICQICETGFKRSSELGSHMRGVHKEGRPLVRKHYDRKNRIRKPAKPRSAPAKRPHASSESENDQQQHY